MATMGRNGSTDGEGCLPEERAVLLLLDRVPALLARDVVTGDGFQDPLKTMRLSRTDSGLWIAQGDSSDPPHALGLVVAQSDPPSGPTLVLPFRPVVRDGLMAYVSESELGLDTLGKAGIAEILSYLPSELTFMNLAMIMKRLDRIRVDSAAHLQLAREIYEDAPVMEALGRFSATEGHVIFSEQGLIALMAQAIIHCRPESNHEFTPEEWQGFKRVLLGAAGLLHDDADVGEYPEGRPDEWLGYITQNLLFNSSANLGNGLARTWRTFGELAADESRTWTTPLDFPAVLEETGLSITQQLTLAFSLYATIGIDTDVIAILPASWRGTCQQIAPRMSPDEVIAYMAATPAEMRAELTSDEAKRFDPELRWASVPFIERPFLRLEDGRIVLVSPRCIEGWPVDGIHYRLLRAATNLDPKNGAQHLTSFAGELTETVTVEMVEDAHERAAKNHPGVGRVTRARPMVGGGESTDILIVEGGDVVLIEVSSSRITASTRLTGDLGALRRDLRKVVVKRVKQLDRTVNAILSDEFADIPSSDVNRVFPVIASVEPMRWTPMLHAFLIQEVPGLLRQRGVQAVQFLEIEDLEALLSVLGPPSLARLLDRKIQEAGIDADVQQWFHDWPLAPRPTRPAIVDDRMDRLFHEMTRHLGFDTSTLERHLAEQRGPTRQ